MTLKGMAMNTPMLDRAHQSKALERAWNRYRRAAKAQDKAMEEWFALPLLDPRNAKLRATYKKREATSHRHRLAWNQMVEEYCR